METITKIISDFTVILSDVLNIKTCSTTFVSTVLLGLTIIGTIIIIKYLIGRKQYINALIIIVLLPMIILLLSYFYNVGRNTTMIVKHAEQDMKLQKESDAIIDTDSDMNKLVEETKQSESSKTIEEKFTMF